MVSVKTLVLGSKPHKLLLPDGVTVCWILIEVFQQFQQSQLDTFFSGDVGVTD